MFHKKFLAISFSALTALAVPSFALAQSTDASELSSEQLEELFSKQKTRGLMLAPTGQVDNDASETVAATTEVAPANKAAETYVELAPEEQVNIQITFDFDSSALRDDQKPKLVTLCQVMKAVDVELFRIVGHTDSSGSASYNESLSLLRAQEVKRHMVSDCGIEETRLEAVGVGEQFPLDQDNPRGDANRRVEFQALS